MSRNQLCGTLDLTNLPADMRQLCLNKNAFSGETDFSRVPLDMYELNVENTNLSGKIVTQRNQTTKFLVDGSNVQIAHD